MNYIGWLIMMCLCAYLYDIFKQRKEPQYKGKGFIMQHFNNNGQLSDKFVSNNTSYAAINGSSFVDDQNFIGIVCYIKKSFADGRLAELNYIADAAMPLAEWKNEMITDRLALIAQYMRSSKITVKFFEDWQSDTPYYRFIIRKKPNNDKCLIAILRFDGAQVSCALYSWKP